MTSLTLLGTKGGPAIRTGAAMPTASVLDMSGQRIVVDCGLAVTRGLVDQGMELRDLTTIFITHLHSDHYLELGPLLHTAWTAGLKTPVTVFGPPGLDRYLTRFLAAMEDDISLRIADEGRPPLAPLIDVRTMTPGPVTTLDGIEVSALRVDHPPLEDCFALSFRSADHHVVMSGDTAPLDAMVDFAKGADLLVHEAMLDAALPALVARVGNGTDALMRHLKRSHTTAQHAARIAQRAGVKRLALNHLLPSDDPTYTEADWHAACQGLYDGELIVGRDGLRIPL
ncbi:MAG: MBL fold metallo-hydrolase [Shimia sp.]